MASWLMSKETPKVTAPFLRAEVESINAFQESGAFHPFTCPNDDHDPEEVLLVATAASLVCPQCDYTQNWVWHWMADGGWKTFVWPSEG